MPANRITNAPQMKIPFANRIMAKMLITIPMSVRIFGCTRRLASKLTMESTTRLPPAPIWPVMEGGSCGVLLIVMHCRKADNLEHPSAGGDFHLYRIAFAFIQKAAADRRRCRNQAIRGVGILAGH